MNIHPTFSLFVQNAAKIAQVLQNLYNEYVNELEYLAESGYPANPILSPESWFEEVYKGTL